MITNFSLGVPCEIADADYPMPLGDYFDIEKDMMQVGGEFLLVRDEESNFYFLCTDNCDIELLCRTYDWYMVRAVSGIHAGLCRRPGLGGAAAAKGLNRKKRA